MNNFEEYEGQSLVQKELEETELYLLTKLRILTDARIDGGVLMAYAAMVKSVQQMKSGLQSKQMFQDTMDSWFKDYRDRR
ncbi:hypothetical protein K9N68_37695 (plasmid) [Kovacikia minuta CCNUW1]|uniref:hypothetical protein n=1 Tax=Kovacikia minuta TaxID=2931930 RepID=UPI001CCB9484|nr:hypothetical protein [Kovacikia minuta]UBF29945.1 hypothetical protein K9N68_37695 [Kovacikia minuta CCNUW1]